jgi:DNA polymerase I-like protein with 3'-5' exonuclease and polymerase domains
VDEVVLKGLPYPEIPDICEYLLLTKRLGQLAEGKEALIRLATPNRREGGKVTGLHHIHGSINSGGTVTHRASHAKPNVAQTPKVGKRFGKEFRSLYAVPRGWKLVGADMSGLELRCLAHYMARWDGMAYGRTILEGKNEDKTDIHSVNQRALGWPDEPASGRKTGGRDNAKTWFYAYLYGAGDEKLGTIGYPTLFQEKRKAQGSADRRRFEKTLPALGYLVAALKKKVEETKRTPTGKVNALGYLLLIDGRRAYVRSEHAALNTLLQGTGAILCKWWINEFVRRVTAKLGPMGWNQQWFLCGWIHDEIQVACREEHAEFIARTAVEAAEAMTQQFAFRCPLTGEAKVGTDWASTH